jgi:hypothetical protein
LACAPRTGHCLPGRLRRVRYRQVAMWALHRKRGISAGNSSCQALTPTPVAFYYQEGETVKFTVRRSQVGGADFKFLAQRIE